MPVSPVNDEEPIDLAGIPLPLSHPAFSSDSTLQHKLKRINTLVEMGTEYVEVHRTFMTLHGIYEEGKVAFAEYGIIAMQIPDMLLAHAVTLYAKSFTASHGSLDLLSQEGSIFGDEDAEAMQLHRTIMGLRHKFYAHREIKANAHQLHFIPNMPKAGDIELITSGQSKTLHMHTAFHLDQFAGATTLVLDFLGSQLDACKASIVNNLSGEQKDYMLTTDPDVLRTEHIMEGAEGTTNPFILRQPNDSN